jgi:hypothetical protein
VNDNIEQKLNEIDEARRMMEFISEPVWSQTKEQTDAEHLKDYEGTLKRTRESFPEMPASTAMNFITLGETGIVLAYVGHSPTSADRARAMVGFLKSMPTVFDNIIEMMGNEIWLRRRCDELLVHNNEQLEENRMQRQNIRQLRAQVEHLLSTIPIPEVA